MKYYWDNFSQCKFYYKNTYLYGIIYKDFIIGANGNFYQLDIVFDNARLDGIDDDDVIIELEWNDLTNAIK